MSMSKKPLGVLCLIILGFEAILGISPSVTFAAPQPRDSSNGPEVVGPQHLAVILVQFTNHSHTRQENNIVENLVRLNAYYQKVSYGLISIDWALTGWFTLNHTSEYYGQDMPGVPPGQEYGNLLLIDSIKTAQYKLDFRQYEHVAVIHAAPDQTITNRTSDLWPHFSWGLNVTTENGVRVDKAFYLSEFDEVGTYAHEFGHSLGLPDLYPPENSGKRDLVGIFSLMDSGNWLPRYPNQSSPGGLDSWSLIQLGWIRPINVSLSAAPVNITIFPLEYDNGTRVVEIPLQNGLHFLLELRTRRGVDIAFPIEALVVYLVNETARMGYEGYGVLNSTIFVLPSINKTPSRFGQELVIELTDCNHEDCSFTIGSVWAHIFSINYMPSNIEALTSYPITITIADIYNMPIPNLNVTLLVDGKSTPLETDSHGNIHYSLFFYSTGVHCVEVVPSAITWPAVTKSCTNVNFPYALVTYAALIVFSLEVIIVIASRVRKRNKRPSGKSPRE